MTSRIYLSTLAIYLEVSKEALKITSVLSILRWKRSSDYILEKLVVIDDKDSIGL